MKLVKKFQEKDLCGDCDIKTKTIRVLATLDEEVKEQTFCHELVHAIKFSMGKEEANHNEEDTDGFAMYLHQYLNTAK